MSTYLMEESDWVTPSCLASSLSIETTLASTVTIENVCARFIAIRTAGSNPPTIGKSNISRSTGTDGLPKQKMKAPS